MKLHYIFIPIAGLLLSTGCLAEPAVSKPNILFIMVDDLRPQLGCYGYRETISPNIDRLAGQGMVFNRAYVQVPVCGASRASLMTGLYPTPDRFVTYYSKAEEDAAGIPDLPAHLKSNGYTTISNGKIYHHADDNTNSWHEIHRPNDFRVYLKPENQGREWKEMAAYEDADVPDNAYPSGALAEKIIGDLRRAKKEGTPFFITAGFTKPHLPFNAPKKYWDMYDPATLELADNPYRPEGAPDHAMHQWNELRDHYGGMPKKGPLSDDLARTLIHGYYACVSYTDAMVGKVMNELDRLGMRDNTIVIFMGDHGWQLGEHALWCKHALFNTSTYTPLMISAPGFRRGLRTDALVEFVDIYPSLCELAGIPLPEHLQGRSFVPLLKKPSADWKKAAFSRYHGGESVTTKRYSYTEWNDGARMLYDHRKDPDENVNVSENPENRNVVEEMSSLLRKHRQRVLSAAPSGASPEAPLAAKGESLKEVYADDFLMGYALGSREAKGKPDYIYPMRQDKRELQIAAREFNCVTAENLMKWQYLQPKPGFFNFDQADELMAFAEKNGQTVVGHALVWHAMLPGWVFKDSAGKTVSRKVLIERMRDHIHTVVGRYKGRIKYWDVVNEAVDTRMVDNGNGRMVMEAFLRDSPWLQIIGEDYIELAFRFAHEADPDALLLYNDYSMTHRAKARFVADMVRGMKAKGVPIHGVGLQAHWHLEYPSKAELQTAIDILAEAGVKISLTELEVGVLPLATDHRGADISKQVELQEELNPYTDGVPGEVLAEQAAKYRTVFEVLLQNREHVERVTFWGIADQYSWKADWPVRGRTAHPLLFDRNYQPKPAYDALSKLKQD